MHALGKLLEFGVVLDGAIQPAGGREGLADCAEKPGPVLREEKTLYFLGMPVGEGADGLESAHGKVPGLSVFHGISL
jgi:hypothetical protein